MRSRRIGRLRFLILFVGLGVSLILFVFYTLTSNERLALRVGEPGQDEGGLGNLAPQDHDTMRHNRSPKFVKGQT